MKMKLTIDLARKVLTGLEEKRYKVHADDEEFADGNPDLQDWVDTIGGVMDSKSYDSNAVLAVAMYTESYGDDVLAHEFEEYVENRYTECYGDSKGQAVRNYAQNDEFGLGRLYRRLEAEEALRIFPWDWYVEDNPSNLADMSFIEVDDTYYLFRDH
jgi:hypothetical protein